MEKVSEEYEKFLNWCEDKWTLDYKWKKLLSKLSNDDKDFLENQYEARLKADMVAMLTELKKEIDKQCKIPNNNASAYDWNNGVYACYKVIQQKIDALKGVEDGKRG